MSGTSIVSKWHLVPFWIPIVSLFYCIFHLLSIVIETTIQAEIVRCMDDGQALWKSPKGGQVGQFGWKQIGWKQRVR